MRNLFLVGASAIVLTASPLAVSSAYAGGFFFNPCLLYSSCGPSGGYGNTHEGNTIRNSIHQSGRVYSGNNADRGGTVDNSNSEAKNDASVDTWIDGDHNTVRTSIGQDLTAYSDNNADREGTVDNTRTEAKNEAYVENDIEGDNNYTNTHVTQDLTAYSGNTADREGTVNNGDSEAVNRANVNNDID